MRHPLTLTLIILRLASVLSAQETPSYPRYPDMGIAERDFLYAGEWDTRHELQHMYLVKGGEVVWSYGIPLRLPDGGIQEFDDATLLPNGNIIFSRMSGAGMVTPEKELAWDYPARDGEEIHSIQHLGGNTVLIMVNGPAPHALIIDTEISRTLKRIDIPTTNTNPHGQFRHIRMTDADTLLVPHLGENKVVEYTLEGKAIWSVEAKSPWSAVRLQNGNTLIAGDWSRYVREVDSNGKTVWQFDQNDAEFYLGNLQTASRLANGNTVICSWVAGSPNHEDWEGTVQAFEVSPDKEIVWKLVAWDKVDLGPATSIQFLDQSDQHRYR